MRGNARDTALACPTCGARLAVRNNFCGSCGTDLRARESEVPAHLQQRIRNARILLEAERKYLTILFADVVGSTALIDDLDPEQAAMLLDTPLQAMVAAVNRHGGIVTRIQGDGIMALFGAPLALEDHAVRACNAALDIRAVGDKTNNRIRVGLHSGEVALRIVRHTEFVEYDAAGLSVHFAAHMEHSASPGTIRMTAATRRLAGGHFITLPLGQVSVKRAGGRDVEAFELCGTQDWRGSWRARMAESLGAFVNRTSELGLLSEAAERVSARRAQVVAIAGQAGTGKSRLVHEFASAKVRDGWRVLEAPAGDEQRHASYLPFARLLRDWCGAEPDAPHADVLHRVCDGLAALDLDAEAMLPPLAALLDMPLNEGEWPTLQPSARLRRCAEAFIRLVRHLARQRRLLLVVEDAHALDEESQDLLKNLIEQISNVPILLIATHRPDERAPDEPVAAYRHVELLPLDDENARRLLDARLGPDPALAPIKAQLAERTQGIPLFVEEMIRTLRETEVLSGEPGRYGLAAAEVHLQVPDTVQSVLAARIDRLSPRRKRILQVAAAIGGEFSLPLLARVLGHHSAQLAGDLDALQGAEFLVARDAKAAPRFAFRHILMEEVTYRGLLSPRRQEIHHAIVNAMEQLYAGRIEHYAESIAWHAAKAEMWDRAIVHNRRAALKAIDRRADPAAIRCIEQALGALTQLTERTSEVIEQEIELRLLLRISLGALGRYEWWAENLDIAERLAQELGDVRRLLAIRVARLHVLNTHGRIDHAIAACRRAEETARAHGDPHQTVAATYFLAQAHNWHGAFADGVAALDRAQPTLDLLPRDSRCGMTGTARLMYDAQRAACHAALGNLQAGLEHGRAAWRAASTSKRDFERAVASFGYGMALLVKGNIEQSIRVLEAGRAATEVSDIPLLFASIAGPLGYAHLLNNDTASALTLTDDLLRRPEVSSYPRAWSLIYRAIICLGSGLDDEAVGRANEALARAQHNGYQAVQATAHWLLGRIARASDPALARHCLDTAAAMAARLGCQPLVAHCMAERARGAAGSGRTDEAMRLRREAEQRYRALGMRFWLLRMTQQWYDSASVTSAADVVGNDGGDDDGRGKTTSRAQSARALSARRP
jgi:class 3 adenylate cyclase/type II secretory pathway predicted ATPase ExeA